jgi:hypothetical protein
MSGHEHPPVRPPAGPLSPVAGTGLVPGGSVAVEQAYAALCPPGRHGK